MSARLTPDQAARVERARKALEASKASNDSDPGYLASRLGVLEVRMGHLLDLISELTGGQV